MNVHEATWSAVRHWWTKHVWKLSLSSLAVATIVLAPGYSPAVRAGETVIRLASLAPRGSSWDRVFRAWNNSLEEKTGGSVSFRFYQGGIAGGERDVIRKMKVGQLDAAGLTSIGLTQIARPVSVLQTPGIFEGYEELNRVRKKLAPEFSGMFEREDYKLLGWGDAGFGRVFSNQPIMVPEDYKKVRPWVPRADPSSLEIMRIVGGNGIALGVPEVLPALQTGMVDTVVASAVAAVALQWFRHTTHMSVNSNTAIVGATLVRKSVYDGLVPDAREMLDETASRAHRQLQKVVIKEDDAAYRTLLRRGMKEFDPLEDPARRKRWLDLNAELIKHLTGRLWTKELLDKVRAAAAH